MTLFNKIVNRYTLVLALVFCLGVFFNTPPAPDIKPRGEVSYDVPIQGKTPDLSAFFAEQERVKQSLCLSYTIYGEARSESKLGQTLVAEVIMNRVQSKHYPDTICEVVRQYKQFSMWNKTKDKRINENFKHTDNAFRAEKPNHQVINAIRTGLMVTSEGYQFILPSNALFYHADYVSPDWALDMEQVTQVDNHIFHKLSP